MALLSERLNIRHAALVLWDEALDQLPIAVTSTRFIFEPVDPDVAVAHGVTVVSQV